MRATGWCGLGDGTDESHARAQAAVDHLMPYTQEFWTMSKAEADAVSTGVGVATCQLRETWDHQVDEALAEATLRRPQPGGWVARGKEGLHSDHLGYVLAEMQSLARQHPGAQW